jgi:hypothetical protein
LHGTATAASELLLRARNRADNIMETLPYVPGSSLRGALAQRWLAAAEPDDTFRRVFQSGAVRFEHAYPLAGDARTVPAPLTFLACKLSGLKAGHVARDLVHAEEGVQCEADEHGACPAALKRVRGFTTTDTDVARVVDEDAALVSRQRVGTMADGSGRVRGPGGDDEGGALFEERLIAAGTRFGVTITGPRELVEHLVAGTGLPPGGALSLGVGRSRTVRGDLTVEWQPPDPAPPPRNHTGDPHVLLLTSDTILLDGYQRSLTNLGSEALVAREILGCEPGDVEIHQHAVRTRSTGGWDALHRMSKPADTAMVAGSLVRFSAPTTAVQQLARTSGLGWRQAEGHGAFLLDAALHTVEGWRRWPETQPQRIDVSRDQIARRAMQLAADLDDKRVSRSLWEGIVQTVRQGKDPRQGDERRADASTELASEADEDAAPSPAALQSRSNRGARSGETQRARRREAIAGLESAVEELGIASDHTKWVQLADDVAKELELRAKSKIHSGGRPR